MFWIENLKKNQWHNIIHILTVWLVKKNQYTLPTYTCCLIKTWHILTHRFYTITKINISNYQTKITYFITDLKKIPHHCEITHRFNLKPIRYQPVNIDSRQKQQQIHYMKLHVKSTTSKGHTVTNFTSTMCPKSGTHQVQHWLKTKYHVLQLKQHETINL